MSSSRKYSTARPIIATWLEPISSLSQITGADLHALYTQLGWPRDSTEEKLKMNLMQWIRKNFPEWNVRGLGVRGIVRESMEGRGRKLEEEASRTVRSRISTPSPKPKHNTFLSQPIVANANLKPKDARDIQPTQTSSSSTDITISLQPTFFPSLLSFAQAAYSQGDFDQTIALLSEGIATCVLVKEKGRQEVEREELVGRGLGGEGSDGMGVGDGKGEVEGVGIGMGVEDDDGNREGVDTGMRVGGELDGALGNEGEEDEEEDEVL